MPGGKKQTVGYQIYLGAHFVLGYGPFDAITEIQVDRRIAWQGFAQDGDDIVIDKPNLFGGDKREGGISGTVNVAMGGPAQARNPYLQSQLGADIPAYRGSASLILNQCYMGNNYYVKPWAIKGHRIEIDSDAENMWYRAKAGIDRGDVTELIEGDPVEDLVGINLTNFVWLATQSSILPNDTFPVGAGLYNIQAPADARTHNTWEAPPTDGDNVILEDELAGYVFCGDNAYIYQVRDSNFFNHPTIENGAGLRLYAAFLVRGNDITGNATPTGEMYDMQPSLAVETTTGSVTVPGNSGVAILADFIRLDTKTEWNGDTGQGCNPSSNEGVMIAKQQRYATKDFKNYQLVVVEWTHSDTCDVYFYLLNGIFPRWNAIGSVAHKVHHYYYDTNGVEQYDLHDVSRQYTLLTGSVQPTGNVSLNDPLADIDCFIGDMNVSGAHFQDTPIDHLELWLAIKAARDEDICETGCRDMNPAHIIREALTDRNWGQGYVDEDINDDSFMDAADTLHLEGMGISLEWNRQGPVKDFIQEIERHIDGVVRVSRQTGQWELKLIRDDIDSNVLVLDETNVRSIQKGQRPTVSELTSAVTVVYQDFTNFDEEASITVHNDALRQVQGNGVATTVQYPGFSNAAVATRAAERDLKALSTPLLPCVIEVDLTAASLNRGDPFILNLPDQEINYLTMRANELDYGDGIDQTITISAIEDVFSTPQAVPNAEPAEEWLDPLAVAPLPAVARVIGEVPYYSLVQDQGQSAVDNALSENNDAGFLLAGGGRQASEFNANVLVDSGSGFVESAVVDFHPWATIENVGYTDTELTIIAGKDLDLVEIGGLAQIGEAPGEELVRVDAVNTDSNGAYVSITVGRGVLDTTPRKHTGDSNGLTIAFIDTFAVSDSEEYIAGEVIDVQLQTVVGAAALETLPTDSVTFDSRAFRPYAPGNLQVDGLSYPDPYTWYGDHTLTWAHRDRAQQTSDTIFDHTAGNIGPEPGTSYRIEGYAFVGDSTVVEQFLNTQVGTATRWGMDSNLIDIDSNMGPPPEDSRLVLMKVIAQRDGYDSYQAAEQWFQVPPHTDSVGDSNGP